MGSHARPPIYLRFLFLLLALRLALAGSAAIVVPFDDTWQFRKGTSEASAPDPTAWRDWDFDDSTWTPALAPFWYGDVQSSPGTHLTDMQNGYTTFFLRRTFAVNNPNDVISLELQAACDDGFIAWINGYRVVRYNVDDGDWPYDYHAIQAAAEPVPINSYPLPDPRQYLRAGANVLAIQVFNVNPGSSDIVFNASLLSSVDDQPPVIASVLPERFSTVRKLASLEVDFDEPVGGIEAADLLVNGQPATNLVILSPSQFGFEFPTPPTGTVQIAFAPNHGIHDLAAAQNPFGGASWTYLLNPNAPVPAVMISEFMAVNKRTIRDEDGDSSDWIELANPTAAAVNLDGWYLTDSTNAPTRWRIPNLTLPAKGYRLIFASGKQRTDPAKTLHTNFKLTSEGGYLALLDPLTNVVSAFGPGYPPQYQDVSYGRDRLAAEVSGYFITPTPGAANASSGAGFGPEVEFSAPSRTFTGAMELRLATHDTNAVIRYALGTNVVTEASTLYTAPLVLSGTTFVRARAFQSGLLPGPLRSESYLRLAANVLSRTSNLPVMVLHNLGKGTIPGPEADQFVAVQVFEPRYGRTALTNAPDLAVPAIFHRRGSSTLGMEKASFFVETRDEFGNDRHVSVAGLPSESDWVLYAPNWFEPVLVHNPTAYELSRQVGQYAPRTRFVEVYLKDDAGTPGDITFSDYNGIYVLEEKIKVGNHRVDIDEMKPENLTPPSVTGGYLMSVDRSAAGTSPLYAGNGWFNALDPDYFEIQPAQRAYLEGYINSFYTALTGPKWTDPALGYAPYIDIPAWLDHHILNVVTFNVDGLRLSGYFHKRRNGPLVMGPVWDFDRTQGSQDGRDFNPRLWRSTVSDRGTDFFNADPIFNNPWYSVLFTDLEFWQKWIDRYQDLRRTTLNNTNLAAIIDGFANEVRAAQPREVSRWGVGPRNGTVSSAGFSYTFPGTYQGEVDFMKRWYSNRCDFIDTNFVRPPVFGVAAGRVPAGTRIPITGDPAGRIYYTLDGSDPRLTGGGIAPNALLYQASVPITNAVRLVARCYDPAHRNLTGPDNPPLNSTWSGPLAATYFPDVPSLLITEIMYHPAPPPAGDTNDVENFAYLELKNTGDSALDLTGFRFTEGIEFTFTATGGVTQLVPGGRVLIVKNRAAFLSRYPNATNIAGEYTGSLDNAGERLRFEGSMQEPILDFAYNNSWYPITDGPGFALVLRDESGSADPALAASWRAGASFNGSPGQADPAPPSIPPILVNEAITHPIPPQPDAVELFNPNAMAVDLAGWFLTDDFGTPRKFVFPPGSRIEPGQYLVVDATQFDAGGPGAFGLSSLGDEVYLFSSDGTNPTGYVHGFPFDAAAPGETFGRYVTRAGTERFVRQSEPTLGARNRGPRVGPVVISEIQFNPPPLSGYNNTLDEFVELANVTDAPQPLFDPAHPENGWRLRGGADFDFPPNLTLAPRGFLVLVNFDPVAEPWQLAAFQAKYGMDSTVPVLGPYQGDLANEGERLTLEAPDAPLGPLDSVPGLVPYLTFDSVHYQAQAPWPVGANGTGLSLQRICPGTFGDDPINWQAATPTAGRANAPGSVDTDQDGLPDDWELAHALNPYDATGDDGATGDPDRDGLTNAQEYLAGTDPRDPASDLTVGSIQVNGDGVVLRFNTVAGHTYSLLAADDPTSPVWTLLQQVPAPTTNGVTTVVDPWRENGRAYRIVTPAWP